MEIEQLVAACPKFCDLISSGVCVLCAESSSDRSSPRVCSRSLSLLSPSPSLPPSFFYLLSALDSCSCALFSTLPFSLCSTLNSQLVLHFSHSLTGSHKLFPPEPLPKMSRRQCLCAQPLFRSSLLHKACLTGRCLKPPCGRCSMCFAAVRFTVSGLIMLKRAKTVKSETGSELTIRSYPSQSFLLVLY